MRKMNLLYTLTRNSYLILSLLFSFVLLSFKMDLVLLKETNYISHNFAGGLRMVKKVAIPQKYQVWIDARKRYRLTDAQVQMARDLGLNPNKFGKLANEKQEPWKKPLPEFIEEIYFKRFGRSMPEVVRSIEEMVQEQREKKAERKIRKEASKDQSSPSK